MANPEHVEVVKRGVVAILGWRKERGLLEKSLIYIKPVFQLDD